MSNYDVSYVFKIFDKFSPAIKEMRKSIEEFDKAINKIEKKVEKANTSFEKFRHSMMKVGKAMAIGVTAPLLAIGTYAIKNAANFQELNKKLLLTTGSTNLTAQAMSRIKKISESTEFAPEELENAMQRMLAFGFSIDESSTKLEMLSNLAEQSGSSLETISNAYTRMALMAKKANGAVDARSLQLLQRQGIPIMAELKKRAEAMGLSLDKMLATGTISFTSVENALNRIAMHKAGKTLEEEMKRTHTIARYFAADLGEAILRVFGITGGIEEMNNKLAIMEDKFHMFLEAHKTLVKIWIVALSLAAAFGPVLIAASMFLSTLVKTWKVLKFITILMWANPLALWLGVAIAIGALALTLYHYYKKSGGVIAGIKQMIDDWCEGVKNIFHYIKALWNFITGKPATIQVKTIETMSRAQGKGSLTPLNTPSALGYTTPSTIAQMFKSTLDINVNAPPGTVKNIRASGDSTVKTNLGRNMAFARG